MTFLIIVIRVVKETKNKITKRNTRKQIERYKF